MLGVKRIKKRKKIEKASYASFGDKIGEDNVLTKEEMAEKFYALKEGDTINVKFTSTINEVCKKKGCWMKLDLGYEKEVYGTL